MLCQDGPLSNITGQNPNSEVTSDLGGAGCQKPVFIFIHYASMKVEGYSRYMWNIKANAIHISSMILKQDGHIKYWIRLLQKGENMVDIGKRWIKRRLGSKKWCQLWKNLYIHKKLSLWRTQSTTLCHYQVEQSAHQYLQLHDTDTFLSK